MTTNQKLSILIAARLQSVRNRIHLYLILHLRESCVLRISIHHWFIANTSGLQSMYELEIKQPVAA